ncbi:hypothetical protein MMPV_004876 [Pyropia vietnamensis]
MAFTGAPVVWVASTRRLWPGGEASAGVPPSRGGGTLRVAGATMVLPSTVPARRCRACKRLPMGGGATSELVRPGSGGVLPAVVGAGQPVGAPSRAAGLTEATLGGLPGVSGGRLTPSAALPGGMVLTAVGAGAGSDALAAASTGEGGGVGWAGAGGPRRPGGGGRAGGSAFRRRRPDPDSGDGDSGGGGWAAVGAQLFVMAASVGVGAVAAVVGLGVLVIAALFSMWAWGRGGSSDVYGLSGSGWSWDSVFLGALVLLLVAAVALPPVAAAVVLIKMLQ